MQVANCAAKRQQSEDYVWNALTGNKRIASTLQFSSFRVNCAAGDDPLLYDRSQYQIVPESPNQAAYALECARYGLRSDTQ